MNCMTTRDAHGGAQPDPSEGRLSIGPLKGVNLQDIYDAMQECGLQLSTKESTEDHHVTTFMSAQGLYLLITGTGVQAYLLGEDGLEACCDEVDDFLLEVLPDGGSCIIEGEHPLGDGSSFVNKSMYIRHGKNIQVNDLRSKITACGNVEPLGGVKPPSLKLCV